MQHRAAGVHDNQPAIGPAAAGDRGRRRFRLLVDGHEPSGHREGPPRTVWSQLAFSVQCAPIAAPIARVINAPGRLMVNSSPIGLCLMQCCCCCCADEDAGSGGRLQTTSNASAVPALAPGYPVRMPSSATYTVPIICKLAASDSTCAMNIKSSKLCYLIPYVLCVDGIRQRSELQPSRCMTRSFCGVQRRQHTGETCPFLPT